MFLWKLDFSQTLLKPQVDNIKISKTNIDEVLTS